MLAELRRAGMSSGELPVAVPGELPCVDVRLEGVTVFPIPARHMGSVAAKLVVERMAEPDKEPSDLGVGWG